MLQQIITAIVSILVPIAFEAIKAQFPDFPLTQSDLLNLILWALGFAFASWSGNNALRLYQIERDGEIKVGGQAYKVGGKK